ncbi:prepilin-type N-terminal cleavage/methylation domain-containing protein [Pseudomarimonas salicorniae]|uniref:Prepilin-type N-terminal cleavage/methylation domain-containing protein n=1 Tax=Pseudomarimonas salicorniae TaxID=2933270 RepID=A0ABT0GE69_9GAMM|nr:prepilin-type N-terminal cleavage/methylation domain-containing protein [Lysobacter sp. CAU 1642]MCK7592850.1 prepilin-type N-terminal cleavage/methylation domain-containing protein [Lysobacter sp. CAU 1642]
MTSHRQQSGFTLVEIAIVLVIIGLLLGGILKGQELIENSRVTNATNDINGTRAAVNAYLDRYRRLPGDDGPGAAVAARGGSWTANMAGNNNGVLDATAAQTFTGQGEVDNFFRQLRAAGFISGDPAQVGAAAMPRNPWGGLLGVAGNGVPGINGRAVCVSQVPGKAATALDNRLDDGNPTTGSFRGFTSGAGVNAAPTNAAAAYAEDLVFTVCAEL